MTLERRMMIFCWGCGAWWIEYRKPTCECANWYDAEYQDWHVDPPNGWRMPEHSMTDEELDAYLRSILAMPKAWRPIEDVPVRDGLL